MKKMQKTYYLSDDNEEFDDEEDCKLHEIAAGISDLPDSLVIMDGNGNRLRKADLQNSYLIFVKDSYAMHCITAMNQFNEKNGFFSGYDGISNVGRWVYDKHVDKWFPYEMVFARYEKIKEAFEKAR